MPVMRVYALSEDALVETKYISRILVGVFLAMIWLAGLFTLQAYTHGRVEDCWFFILPPVAYFCGYYAMKWAQLIDDGRDD